MHFPRLHKYIIKGMSLLTYIACLFNGICQLLMSLVYGTDSEEDTETDSCEELHLQ